MYGELLAVREDSSGGIEFRLAVADECKKLVKAVKKHVRNYAWQLRANLWWMASHFRVVEQAGRRSELRPSVRARTRRNGSAKLRRANVPEHDPDGRRGRCCSSTPRKPKAKNTQQCGQLYIEVSRSSIHSRRDIPPERQAHLLFSPLLRPKFRST